MPIIQTTDFYIFIMFLSACKVHFYSAEYRNKQVALGESELTKTMMFLVQHADVWPLNYDLKALHTKMVCIIIFIHMTGAELVEIFGLYEL